METGCENTHISKELRLNVNTIKSNCMINRLAGDGAEKPVSSNDMEVDESRCKCCGIFIVQKEGVKRKIFCSDKCRMTWWNANKNLVQRKAEYTFVCQNCGEIFNAYGNKKRKYFANNYYIENQYGKKW